MIVLIPTPREMRYSDERFTLGSGLQLFLDVGEDATHEVVCKALKKSGDAILHRPLLQQGAATLIIARDMRRANSLLRETKGSLDEEITTPVVHRDGVYFPQESTRSRQMAKKLNPYPNDEQYFLRISNDGIVIRGRSRRGLFWGVQTLRQIIAGSDGGVLAGLFIRDWPTQAIRGQHLDMKVFFQKTSALEEWLRSLAELKLNTVVFEYEDKFPYQHRRFLRHESAFTPAQLKRVLNTARRYHIQVIPLTQSLGHFEYALQHEELAHLRELPDIYFQLCPTNPESQPFVRDIIDEVWDYHPDAEYYHIGGDETWCLGECPRCAETKRKHREIELYLNHLVPLLDYTVEKGKRPILWDDMIRERAELVQALPRETVLGYWEYGTTRESHHARELPEVLRSFNHTHGREPELWPDALSSFPFFEYYQQQGFEVLAVPCGNYGTIVPNDVHSARNTLKFAEKAAVRGGLGTLNTQWAGFQTLFSNGMYSYAMTAESAWSFPPSDTAEFDGHFSRIILGDEEQLLLAASRLVAEGAGFRSPRAGRPLNLLHFALMDTELHFPGGLAERRRWGAHPPHIDFHRVLRRKLELLAELPDRSDLLARLSWVEAQMASSLNLLAHAKPKTRVGREMADVLGTAARFKQTRSQTMRLLMGEPSRFTSNRAAWKAEQERWREIQAIYARVLRPADVEFQLCSLFEGEMTVLRSGH